jgi:hypothetical protein
MSEVCETISLPAHDLINRATEAGLGLTVALTAKKERLCAAYYLPNPTANVRR